ncbi:hypothetical protein [Sphingomonas sp.]|uniref:hypothetical protein n=1 Tax=Sphingomonas sp. TaxID=28214 RepID=UPI003BAB94E3
MILAAILMILLPADDDTPCSLMSEMPNWPQLSQDVLRPGDKVSLTLMWRDGPFGSKPVPQRCFRRLKVSGPAVFDKKVGLQIADTAKAGDTVTISVLIDGKPKEYRIAITGREEQVLTGTWRPRSNKDCRGKVPGEIVFTANGYYSFTFPEMMVETMTSGGGRFRWDAATSQLFLDDTLRGKAWFEGKTLVLDGVEFDQTAPPPLPGQPAPPPCRLVLG